jgi:hypothetical protein
VVTRRINDDDTEAAEMGAIWNAVNERSLDVCCTTVQFVANFHGRSPQKSIDELNAYDLIRNKIIVKSCLQCFFRHLQNPKPWA